MSHLLLFTIGPVQSLIGSSRKMGDMYAGSKLLSRLMEETVQKVEDYDGDVLIPIRQVTTVQSEEPDEESNMPNRLLAEFKSVDQKALEQIAQELERDVKNRFWDICRDILQKADIREEGIDLARKQLADFLEVYWLVEPYTNKDYKQVYAEMFRKLQAIKGIRPFAQAMEPWGRKCMLFPEYNAIFAKKSEHDGGKEKKLEYPHYVNPRHVYDISQNDNLTYYVKSKEALSAIALVKRCYGMRLSIGSLRLMLLKSRMGEDLKNLYIEKGQCREDLLANAVYDYKNGNSPDFEEYNEDTWKAGNSLYGELCKEGRSLSSYYALVKFDGDSMGDRFLDKDTPAQQRELSSKIGIFAKKTPGILKEHKGIAVFAGGEDFLGFLPVETLFPCLVKLRQTFGDDVGGSFSAGVVVAHLMQPLKEVNAMAEEMEGLAKEGGKNAAVVGVMKRSGEQVVTPAYKFSGDTHPTLQEVVELLRVLREEGCSKSLLYHIGELFRCFQMEGSCPGPEPARVLILEAAVASGAEKPEELTNVLMHFYQEADQGLGFLNTLNAVTFLAREVAECCI